MGNVVKGFDYAALFVYSSDIVSKGELHMGIYIQNGRILDPATQTDEVGTVYLENGVIQKQKEDQKPGKNDRVIDAKGCFVMPGLIDMHVHFRDPGQEYKEDIESGSRAAAHGGVTTVVTMPNTRPVIDSPDRYAYVENKAKLLSPIHVLQTGAITRGQKGEELADIEGMVQAGVKAISEDGKSVMNTGLAKKAFEVAARLGIPVLDHCEDADLVQGGCMNEDENSRRLHLPGISNATEDSIAARDIILAHETGAHLHLCHCSTRGVAEMVRAAKKAGYPVSAEVCPHHFVLTSDDIVRDDPNYKMNPPLRAREDVDALIQGLKEGYMEVISTDHAPHSQKDKEGSMRTAAFGIVGIETSLALTYTELVEKGFLTPLQMVEKMSWNPARIMGLDSGTLQEGHPADVVIMDPEAEYMIDKKQFLSKGKNTPFHGRKVKGKVMATICGGRLVYQDPELKIEES